MVSELTVSMLAAIAVLGVGVWANRAEIQSLQTSLFGHSDNGGGHIEEFDSLADEITEIRTLVEDESESRIDDHRELRNEVQRTRRQSRRHVEELVLRIDKQSDEIDIKPDEFNELDYTDDDSRKRGYEDD